MTFNCNEFLLILLLLLLHRYEVNTISNYHYKGNKTNNDLGQQYF